MMRSIRKILFFVVVLAVVGFLMYTKVLRPIPVVGHEVKRSDLVIEVMGTGSIQARVSAVVSSKIQGQVLHLEADRAHLSPRAKSSPGSTIVT